MDECKPLHAGGGEVWVFGGSDGEGFRDELYVFNLSENKWRQIKKPETAAAASRWPPARGSHTANVVKASSLGAAAKGIGWRPDANVMIIFGGMGNDAATFLGDVWARSSTHAKSSSAFWTLVY